MKISLLISQVSSTPTHAQSAFCIFVKRFPLYINNKLIVPGDVAVEVPPDAVGVLPEMSDEESSGDEDDNKNDLYEEFLNGIELSDSEDNDEETESKHKKRRQIFESKKEIFQDIVRLQALVAEQKVLN